MSRFRSRAELRAIFAKIHETRAMYQDGPSREIIQAEPRLGPMSEAAKAERDAIQNKNVPPDWAKDDFTDDSDYYDRVVWDVKRGQDLETNSLSSLDVYDGAKEWRGLHTGDSDYWTRRLAKDYGRSRKEAQIIQIRPHTDDFLVEDPQYMTDPDTGDKASSAVLVTRRRKLRYGVDWVFEGEDWKD